MFFQLLITGSMISGLIIGLWNRKYERIMDMDAKNFKDYYKHYDFYLEEIIKYLNYFFSKLIIFLN